MKNLDAAQRLVGDDGKPEHVTQATRDWQIRTHDSDEHHAIVTDRRGRHIANLRALERALGELKTIATATDSSGRMLSVPCLFASSLLHEIEKRERELVALIGMHERHLAVLESTKR